MSGGTILTLIGTVFLVATASIAAGEVEGFTGLFADGSELVVFGTGFGEEEGSVYLTDEPQWSRSEARHELGVSRWRRTLVTIDLTIPLNERNDRMYLHVRERGAEDSLGFGPLRAGIGLDAVPLPPGQPQVISGAAPRPRPAAPRPEIGAAYGLMSDDEVVVITGRQFSRGPTTNGSNEPPSVRIGNASNWPECSVRHPVGLRDWSRSKITLDFALPANPADEDLYLFVIDSDGNASDGFPVPAARGPGQPGPPTRF